MNAQDVIDALTEQRNAAYNALAMAEATNRGLKRELEFALAKLSAVDIRDTEIKAEGLS